MDRGSLTYGWESDTLWFRTSPVDLNAEKNVVSAKKMPSAGTIADDLPDCPDTSNIGIRRSIVVHGSQHRNSQSLHR